LHIFKFKVLINPERIAAYIQFLEASILNLMSQDTAINESYIAHIENEGITEKVQP
jgi:hypothetical protein